MQQILMHGKVPLPVFFFTTWAYRELESSSVHEEPPSLFLFARSSVLSPQDGVCGGMRRRDLFKVFFVQELIVLTFEFFGLSLL